jgi:hypothetical protein
MRAIFLFFLTIPLFATAQLTELFDDGNFTESPQWLGTTEKFDISPEKQLHLSAPAAASEAWLFTPSLPVVDATWELSVKLEFDPSSQNYSKIFLIADASEPALIKNGFFVMIGGANDDISLYQLNNNTSTKVIDGLDGRCTSNVVDIKIKATRNKLHEWTLETFSNNTWNSEGVYTDNLAVSSSFFGIYCKFTQTRSTKFYFDDISIIGKQEIDETLPLVNHASVPTGYSIKVDFSKEMDPASLLISNTTLSNNLTIDSISIINSKSATFHLHQRLPDSFSGQISISHFTDKYGNELKDTTLSISYKRGSLLSLTPSYPNKTQFRFSKPIDTNSTNANSFLLIPDNQVPGNITWLNDSTFVATFNTLFQNKTNYTITSSSILDIQGDTITNINQSFSFINPQRNDIVFSEIMTDPLPSVNLPENEYIELKNRTDFDINLSDYTLLFKDKKYPITGGILPANGYAILIAAKNRDNWASYGNLALLNSFPTLTNDEGSIALLSPQSKIIANINYSTQWKKQTFKDDGGWSFELIDENNLSGSDNNWDYSVNLSGGTPGTPNSVEGLNTDLDKPYIKYLTQPYSLTINLYFSEGIEELTNDPSQIEMTDSNNQSLIGFSNDTINANMMTIKLKSSLPTFVNSQLHINTPIKDFSGNQFSSWFPLTIGHPDSLEANDVIINEIMFNPNNEGVDYIEITNRTNKTILLSDLYITQLNLGQPVKLIQLSNLDIPICKDQFWVFSTDSASINNFYKAKAPWYSLQVSTFPSMPDDEGEIAITNSKGIVIDKLAFTEKWHYPLLHQKENISLERISIDAPTQSSSNWQSTAETSGFATPTQPNSQIRQASASKNNELTISPEIITPDNDGIDDFTTIRYENPDSQTSITLKIYNARGSSVKQLSSNELSGSSNFYKWDGTTDAGEKAEPGIYIVWCRLLKLDGSQTEFKKTITIASCGR